MNSHTYIWDLTQRTRSIHFFYNSQKARWLDLIYKICINESMINPTKRRKEALGMDEVVWSHVMAGLNESLEFVTGLTMIFHESRLNQTLQCWAILTKMAPSPGWLVDSPLFCVILRNMSWTWTWTGRICPPPRTRFYQADLMISNKKDIFSDIMIHWNSVTHHYTAEINGQPCPKYPRDFRSFEL